MYGIANPFTDAVGPQPFAPSGQAPIGPDPQSVNFMLLKQAQDEALHAHINGLLSGMNQNVQAQGLETLGKGIGTALRPTIQGAKAALPAAATTYSSGGAVTLGAKTLSGSANPLMHAAGPLVATTAPAEDAAYTGATVGASLPTTASAPAATPGLFAQLSPYLSAAGIGYGSYEGLKNANLSNQDLHATLSSGLLTPSEEQALRQHYFNAGMQNMGIGGASGGLGGFLIGGPIGAAAGAAAGGSGGAWQATHAFNSPVDTFKASIDFAKHPWKR